MSWAYDEKIHEVFMGFDMDGSGVLEKKELKNALALLGIDLTVEELNTTYCLDGDPESLTEDEFRKLISEKIGEVDFQQRLAESLQEFDEDGSHVVSRAKMKEILTMRGTDQLDDDEAEAMLEDLNFDDNGYIDYSEVAKQVYGAEEDSINTQEAS